MFTLTATLEHSRVGQVPTGDANPVSFRDLPPYRSTWVSKRSRHNVPQTHTHIHTGGRQVKVCSVFSTLPSDCVSHFTKKFADKVNRLSTAVCSKTVYSTWQNPTEILEFDYKNMHQNYGIWIHTSLKTCQLKFLKRLLIQGHQMNGLCYWLVSICHYAPSRTFSFFPSAVYLFALGLRCFLLAFCSCSVQASHCSSFFCCGAWALGFLGFSSCGMRTQ